MTPTRLRYLWLVLLAAMPLGAAPACGGGGGDSADARPRPDARPVDAQVPDALPLDAAYSCPVLSPSGAINMPKNIIIVLGDGMGPKHVEAGRLLRGAQLHFEALAAPVMLNTDSLDWEFDGDVTDSAAGATAIATGVRVRNEVISIDGTTPLKTIAEHAKDAGKAIGLITTASTYDASPASFVAHHSDRDDRSVIATQILSTFKPDVLLGGDLDEFTRNDGALTTLATSEGYQILNNATDLGEWDTSQTTPTLGVFHSSATAPAPFEILYAFFMTPFTLRDGTTTDPLLPAMVTKGLERLETDTDGFFLFVENEQIDTLSHVAIQDLAISAEGVPAEVLQLDDTVKVIIDWIESQPNGWNDTLLLVGADHETGDYMFTGADTAGATFPKSPFHTRANVGWYIKGPGSAKASTMCGLPDLYLLMTGQLP